MIKIAEVINEILKFSPAVLTLHKGVDEDKISEFEKRFGLALPNDYKDLLRWSNGLELMGIVVFGIFDDSILSSLGGAYKVEHYEVGNAMTLNLVPFSPDGGGNHYCFDSKKCDEQSCQISFWQHNLSYTEDESPEVVNHSFAEWVKEVVIDWTLEDYDHNGVKNNN